MEGAECLIYGHAEQLCTELSKRIGKPLDISVWLEYYTFDLMGMFGLTIDFGNLTHGEYPILSLYHMAYRKLGPLAAAPWIKRLLMGIPYVERMKYYWKFMDWAHSELERNIQVSYVKLIFKVDTDGNDQMKEDKRKNVIGYVLEHAMSHGGLKKNWNFVLGDFVLVIVAGRYLALSLTFTRVYAYCSEAILSVRCWRI